VLNGAWYVIGGLASPHFRTEMPATYTPLRPITYGAATFALLPAMILTRLPVSPSSMAAAPDVRYIFRGRPSARPLHFSVCSALVLFLIVHIAMVWMTGFTERMRAMITGFTIPQGTRDD